MLFNSFTFFFFFFFVFIAYWVLQRFKLRFQNIFLLIASYIFYGFWDSRFLSLILLSTLLNYCFAILISKWHQKKLLYILGIFLNLIVLGFFKYFNFFIDSFSTALSFLGVKTNLHSLNILLPLGISFYTFHGLSYLIDIYNAKIKPVKNLVDYGLFVGFFPLLIAGPIERATHFLPQIQSKRFFDFSKAVDGSKQILWGLFKKAVIADGAAEFANLIFNNYTIYSGYTLALGALLFAIQIYCDFSGYSDMAIGLAKLLGFDLLQNFSYPYFSRDIAEFWRRWHISLTSWFRDYLYIPIGGSKKNKYLTIRNTIIVFLVSGFWHGANWTFLFWGLFNALCFLPLLFYNRNRINLEIVANNKRFPSFKEFSQIIRTFCLVVFAWIFFRSDNLSASFDFIKRMFLGFTTLSNISETYSFILQKIGISLPLLILFFIAVEWSGRRSKYALEFILINYPKAFRWTFYYLVCFLIFLFCGKQQQFIYFQF